MEVTDAHNKSGHRETDHLVVLLISYGFGGVIYRGKKAMGWEKTILKGV